MDVFISDDDVFAALKTFIQNVLPGLVPDDVRQGQQNDVPMPPSNNFVIMIPADRKGLATTEREYDPTNGLRATTRSTQVGAMVNFYGEQATDNAQTFNLLFRDLYGCDFLAAYGVQPLWCDDGRQMPLLSSEKQYVTRWMVQAVMQINPTVSTRQQFADKVTISLVEADKNG